MQKRERYSHDVHERAVQALPENGAADWDLCTIGYTDSSYMVHLRKELSSAMRFKAINV